MHRCAVTDLRDAAAAVRCRLSLVGHVATVLLHIPTSQLTLIGEQQGSNQLIGVLDPSERLGD
jgi:hypothetical protein